MATAADSTSSNIPYIPHNTPTIAVRDNAQETRPEDGARAKTKRVRSKRPGYQGGRWVGRAGGGTDSDAGSRSNVEGNRGGGDGNAESSRPPRRNHPRPQKQSGNDSSTSASSTVAHRQPGSGPRDSSKQQNRPPRRGRGTRFNAELSENPAGNDTQEPNSEGGNRRYRNPAPKQDDLTSTLIHSLKSPPYRDCLICFSAIRPFEPIWSCSSLAPTSPGSDDEKAGSQAAPAAVNTQCCWTPFHLKCIRQWASKSVKDLADAWRARGEDRPGSWRCPGCQSKRLAVPSGYWCALPSCRYCSLQLTNWHLKVFLRVYCGSEAPSTGYPTFMRCELLAFACLWACLSAVVPPGTMSSLSSHCPTTLFLRKGDHVFPMLRRV